MQQEQISSVILAQKPPRLIAHPRFRLLVALLVLPLLVLVAAFSFAPGNRTASVEQTQVVDHLVLPSFEPNGEAAAGFWREERIQRGDTVAALLARLGADREDAAALTHAARSARAVRQLIPGRVVRAHVAADGQLLALRYQNGGEVLTAEREGSGWLVTEQPAELERRVKMASGEITSSLFGATDAANLPDAVALQIADIFSSDIDFHRDLRRGDRFSVVYEMEYDHGEPVRPGRVLAAEFVNQRKSYQALWFEYAQGRGGYYTPDGESVRRAFLRAPLEFTRVSSGFTRARFHPILKQWRAHRGIDYAAPVGTPVRATGTGTVEFVGRQGAYGNLVVLRHQSRYTTWYAHLSRFAKGLRKGARVEQGQVIGFVGATGMVTGPHLHYEFRVNNVHQDPLRVVLPPAPPLEKRHIARFKAAAEPMAQQLALLRGLNYARID
jgi:murein DD-endopeptidase MepM/ murein hydrolase activator NlpD